ncbi:aminoglycoside 6'-N-acetyltransferase [Alkalicoccus urumqiensis]|uniref:Aminoglycoside N(6')-acetyltransferase type 1 n=1 Tax=Alkalicoccus urumqiensis TaxID=1548213 RepID=A0A2P6MLE8_ALKUR|nr:aminoglycoside 6'-N-acetyltransferase [Alkalicoccus urumqiensis]PRO67094.1 GNAT family N-acetyltransferase [Alkalicoccus urumqiensis]
MEIERVQTERDVQEAVTLASELWPESVREKLEREMQDSAVSRSASVWLARMDGRAVSFLHATIRREYVEGAEPPTGYIEGVYTRQEARRKGIAGTLIQEAERWARERGCRWVASDSELDNAAGQQFHRASGFSEAARVVCFSKRISAGR